MGDHIEKLNGEVMIGKRHYEVAKILKDIPKGTQFTIRLVEPLKSGFTTIAPKTGIKSKKAYGSGRETLRFKADGKAEIAQKVLILSSSIYLFMYNLFTFRTIQWKLALRR